MTNSVQLRALYFPYSRCANEITLKRCVLLFDELGFVDPTSPEMREALITDKREIPQGIIADWSAVRDHYGLLMDRGIIKFYDPEPIIQKHDKLLGAALKADLNDDAVWKLCTTPGTPSTWSVLRRKVPSSAFEFLNSQVGPRINYGTARAKAFFHQEFLEWPNLSNSEFKSDHSPFDANELGEERADWYRYIFHDRKVAIERDRYGKKASIRKRLQDVELSCNFPFTHGSSLAVNTALLLADSEGLVPFTDSALHHEMLSLIYRRATTTLTSSSPPIFGVKRLDARKLSRVALTLLDIMVPDETIESLSISQCLKYRNESAEAFRRLKNLIGELTSQLEAEPMTDEFENEMRKIVYQKVIPEAQKARDKGIEVYEKLFGKLANRVAAAVTPTLGASIFAGLSSPVMLAVAGAAAFGAVLPDLVDTLLEERTMRRNSLSYLLKLSNSGLGKERFHAIRYGFNL
jgi:hypothetical protein